jgi:hypothetical protein
MPEIKTIPHCALLMCASSISEKRAAENRDVDCTRHSY